LQDLGIRPVAEFTNRLQLFGSKPQTLQTLDLAQFRERQSEDHGVEALRFGPSLRVEARDDPPALDVERRKRLSQPHVDLVLKRRQQPLDQRGRSALDAVDFIALAK
jgi:hypothetical protein